MRISIAGYRMGWDTIRNLFRGNSTKEKAIQPLSEEQEDARLQPTRDLLEAFMLQAQDGDPEAIIAHLRAVADSPIALADTRAYCLVTIGEQYLGKGEKENWDRARQAFSELIESNLPWSPSHVLACIYRGGMDSNSDDPGILASARRDFDSALGSSEIGLLKSNLVVNAHIGRAKTALELGDLEAASGDFNHVIEGSNYSLEDRVRALREKANWFAGQGRWTEALRACFDVIGNTDDIHLSRSAEVLFSFCFDRLGGQGWSLVIDALNTFEKSNPTEGQQRLILLSRIRAYDARGAEGDEGLRANDMAILNKDDKLPTPDWASNVIKRVMQHMQLEDELSRDSDISDLYRVVSHLGLPDDLRAHADYFLGKRYRESTDEKSLNRAVHHFGRALSYPYLDAFLRQDALLERSQIFLSAELFDAVISDCTEVLRLVEDPRSICAVVALDSRAKAYAARRNPDDLVGAMQDLDALLTLPGLSMDTKADVYLRRGELCMDENSYREAVESFSAAIAHAENNLSLRSWAHIYRSSALYFAKMDSGIEDLNTVIQGDGIPISLRGHALFDRGRRHLDLGMPENAQADVDELLALPDIAPLLRANAVYLRATVSLECLDPEAAIVDLETAIADPLVMREHAMHCRLLLGQTLSTRQSPGDSERAKAEVMKVVESAGLPEWMYESAKKLLTDLH